MTDAVLPNTGQTTGDHSVDRPASIEIGVIFTGDRHDAGYRNSQGALEQVRRRLQTDFPEFEFLCQVLHRRRTTEATRIEPAELLQLGTEERDAHEWDFAIVVSPDDLTCRYQPFAYGVVSRSLDLAVLSTSRLQSLADTDDEQDASDILTHLMLHVLGHLNGLVDDSDQRNVMCDPQKAASLRADAEFNEAQLDAMRRNLKQIADVRLEERAGADRQFLAGFYLRGGWINAHEIVDAVIQAKPWEFPIRLARLTAAAVSSILLLLITAETWDLALNQSNVALPVLFACSLLLTTMYVVKRQRLLVGRRRRRATEQAVIANLSAVGIVFIGMLTTALLLFGLAFAAGFALFPTSLIAGWAASIGRPADTVDYLRMAGFVASIGVLVGALGASFEEQQHFRHIVLVDEEV